MPFTSFPVPLALFFGLKSGQNGRFLKKWVPQGLYFALKVMFANDKDATYIYKQIFNNPYPFGPFPVPVDLNFGPEFD